MFVTGEHAWRTPPAWPPAEATPRTFFSARRRRARRAPRPTCARGAIGPSDEYVSDPNRPVPYVPNPGTGMRRDYMTEDQRFAATRPDVLVYQTPPLAEDLTVAGPIHVSLQVSTTGTDADWVVKVIDVYPEDATAPVGAVGRAARRLPAAGARRAVPRQVPRRASSGRCRSCRASPRAIAFELPDVAHTFRRGHRLMVHVQSSWFPLVDRNPQVFMDIPAAKAADFRPATQRVWRSADRPSSIRVLTLPAAKAAATAGLARSTASGRTETAHGQADRAARQSSSARRRASVTGQLNREAPSAWRLLARQARIDWKRCDQTLAP